MITKSGFFSFFSARFHCPAGAGHILDHQGFSLPGWSVGSRGKTLLLCGNDYIESASAEFIVDFLAMSDLQDQYGLALYLTDDAVVAYAQFAIAGEAAAERFAESYGVEDEAAFYCFADAVLDVPRKAGDIMRYFRVILGLEKHYLAQMSLCETAFPAL